MPHEALEVEKDNPWAPLMEEAQEYEQGSNGHLQDYAEAFSLYRDAARLGSARAYAEMGRLTEEGRGVRCDGAAALELYKKSAAKGYHAAWFHMMGWYASA